MQNVITVYCGYHKSPDYEKEEIDNFKWITM